MNILKESGQQLKVRHEYLTATKIHAPTTIAQTLTGIGYKLKIFILDIIIQMAVGHLLWSYIDYNLAL